MDSHIIVNPIFVYLQYILSLMYQLIFGMQAVPLPVNINTVKKYTYKKQYGNYFWMLAAVKMLG